MIYCMYMFDVWKWSSHIIDHFQMGELCGVRVCTASTPSIKTLPNVGPRRPLAHVGKCSCMFGLFGPKQIRINWAHDNGFFFAKTCGKLFGCTVGKTHGSSFFGIEMAESKLNSQQIKELVCSMFIVAHFQKRAAKVLKVWWDRITNVVQWERKLGRVGIEILLPHESILHCNILEILAF